MSYQNSALDKGKPNSNPSTINDAVVAIRNEPNIAALIKLKVGAELTIRLQPSLMTHRASLMMHYDAQFIISSMTCRIACQSASSDGALYVIV